MPASVLSREPGGSSHPTLRQVASTWTLCGGRLLPRRANERYTAEPAACARPGCQAYHRRPGRATCRPPRPRLAHSRCPQSRAAPPSTPAVLCWPMPAALRQNGLTPTPTMLRQLKFDPPFIFDPLLAKSPDDLSCGSSGH